MNCRQVRDLLPLYADGDLESTTQSMVAEHLQGCPACRARLDLDVKLAAELTAYTPPANVAAMRTTLRSKVMAEVDQERRRQPIRRAVLRLGNAASWVAVSGIAAALVLGIAITVRPLAERAWRGQTPAGTPTSPATPAPAPSGLGWQVVNEQVIASPYYWIVDGERVDRTPQISPDGTKIAYLPTVDGKATDIDRLVVRDLATGKDLDLTPEAGYSYTSVRWSPDGKSLAFLKYRSEQDKATPSELWRVDAGGGNLKRLYSAPGDAPMRGPAFAALRWSADGRDVWIGGTIWGGSSGCLRVHADGSGTEEVKLPTGADFGAREDALSAMMAFSPADDYVLHAVKSDGLLAPPKDAPVGGDSLVLYDIKSKESRVLGSFEGTIYVSDSSISPEGDWISFTTLTRKADGMPDKLRLWTVRRDGSALHEVMLNGQPAPAYMPGPVWAGGGRAYFNQSPEVSAIWICELDASSGQAGLIGHSYPARDLVSVSRDGRRLLTMRGEWEKATLYLLELAPKPADAPTVAPTPTAQPAAAAPEFGAPRDLFTPPPSAGFYRVSPDGQWVLYPVPGGRTADGGTIKPHLEAYKTSSGEVATIEIVAAGSYLSGEGQYTWFPDSRRLLVATSGDGGQILTVALGSKAVQTLAKAPQGSAGFGEAAISPDGARIAYTVIYPANPAPVPKIGIEVMNADGSSRKQIVAPDYFIGQLAWTPDGSQVVYFKSKGGTPPEDGDAYVVDVAGSEPKLLFPRLRLAAWSPSGTQALWLSQVVDGLGRADLYLGPWPAAGQPALVVRGVTVAGMAGAVWAGSDDWLIYSKDGALYLAQNGGRGQPVRLTPTGDEADAPLWVPGQGLIYRVAREGRAALRLLPLKGAESPSPTAVPTGLTATATWQGATGALAGRILFTNQGTAPLTLEGVPQVALQDASGAALDVQTAAMPANAPAGPVTLQSGGQAAVQFVWRNYCGKAAGPFSMRVLLPSGQALTAPVVDSGAVAGSTPRCDEASAPSTLAVGAFEPVEAPATPVPPSAQDPGSLRALHMVDARIGWALAERAILRTADGGATWADVTPQGIATPAGDGNAYWGGQHFIDAGHAWVAMSMNTTTTPMLTFLRTADGGRTWQASKSPVQGGGALFTSIDGQRGWALVSLGAAAGSEAVAVLGTTDGGTTWTLLSATDFQNPQPGQIPFGGDKLGIGFADAANGWVGLFEPVDGKILLYATHDGGRTWAEQSPALPAGYENAQASPQAPVFFSAQEGVLAVGLWRHESSTVFYTTRDGGATWTPTTPVDAAAGGLARSAFISAGEGWALVQPVPGTTDRVELRHTTDGGRTWTALTSDPALEGALELQFVDSSLGWALCTGEQGTYLLKTIDGGRAWARAQ